MESPTDVDCFLCRIKVNYFLYFMSELFEAIFVLFCHIGFNLRVIYYDSMEDKYLHNRETSFQHERREYRCECIASYALSDKIDSRK